MTKFLVSDEHPDGYQLEDILRTIRKDILHRCNQIIDDERAEADHVARNNMKILNLITEAMELAEDSTRVLNKAFGPGGEHPRIGS